MRSRKGVYMRSTYDSSFPKHAERRKEASAVHNSIAYSFHSTEGRMEMERGCFNSGPIMHHHRFVSNRVGLLVLVRYGMCLRHTFGFLLLYLYLQHLHRLHGEHQSFGVYCLGYVGREVLHQACDIGKRQGKENVEVWTYS